MSKFFFKKAALFFKGTDFPFENQIFAQFLSRNYFQTNGSRQQYCQISRAFVWNENLGLCRVFLKISTCLECGASVRRTFDHNLWEL